MCSSCYMYLYKGGIVNSLEHLTDEIREDYDGFLTEIDAITYYAYRQVSIVNIKNV